MFKTKARLKENIGEASPAENQHLSKPTIAASIHQALCDFSFEFKQVLADSEYGESGSSFVAKLFQFQLPYVLAIRSNHEMWLPQDQHIRANRWHTYKRTFSDGRMETRFIREILYGKRRAKRY